MGVSDMDTPEVYCAYTSLVPTLQEVLGGVSAPNGNATARGKRTLTTILLTLPKN